MTIDADDVGSRARRRSSTAFPDQGMKMHGTPLATRACMQTSSPTSRGDGRPAIRSIDSRTLFGWLASGRRLVVIDVREPGEIERSPTRFPGALEIPLEQLFTRRNQLPHRKVDTVVTVSSTGARSRTAAFTLSLLGYTDTYSLDGGLDVWTRKGLPLA
jgi:rhodanese-related sulfurtransferase